MAKSRKFSKVAQAYEKATTIRYALHAMRARCMEVTEDECGILWERWVTPNGVSMVVFATPQWFEVFVPLKDWQATIESMKRREADRV
jgi:hypothetical protein